jgi:hypothetical protein
MTPPASASELDGADVVVHADLCALNKWIDDAREHVATVDDRNERLEAVILALLPWAAYGLVKGANDGGYYHLGRSQMQGLLHVATGRMVELPADCRCFDGACERCEQVQRLAAAVIDGRFGGLVEPR